MANTQHTALCISALVCIFASTIEGRIVGEENAQLSANRYSKYDYPTAFTNKSTKVDLSFYVKDMWFTEESAGRGILEMNVYFRQLFTDPRLKGAVKQGNIVLSRDPWRKWWVPDTFAANADYVRVTEDKDIMKTNLYRFNSDGEVYYVTELNIGIPYHDIRRTSSRQVTVRLESFAYKQDEITLAWRNVSKPVQIEPSIQIKDYVLVSQELADCSVTYTSGTYPCLSVTFRFKKD